MNASDVLVERLIDWRVDTVFGLPGDGINGIMEALRTRQDRIRFVQVRHEEAAAFAACGYAKFAGRLGVCLATSGPGAIHLLNGLYDAKMDGAPVLAVTGQTYHDLLGMQYQQEVNLLALYQDVASFNQQVMGAGHVRSLVDRACRAALANRSVAHITFPVDYQEQSLSDAQTSKKMVSKHTSNAWRPPLQAPREQDLRAAAAVLAHGERPVILIGQGAVDCAGEIEAVAETLGAPVVKALLGKSMFPDTSRFSIGGIGLLGTRPAQDALENCDLLLMVGTSFPYMEYYPEHGQAKAVQIDIDPTRIGLRYPVDVGLTGDAKYTLQALLPLLQRRQDRRWLDEAQRGMQAWRELMQARAGRADTPLKPQFLAARVNDLLAPNAIVATDSGTITTWAARYLDMKPGMKFSCSGNLATMAPGLPYAVGAQVAYPDRQVVAFVGDGGFTMLMGEFATAVKHGLPIKVVIVKNNTLGQIKWEQMVFLGNPEYGCELHPIDFVKYAEACGGAGFRCERPDEVRPALEAAFSHSGPALVEAVVDPFEAPMPPKATLEQAVHMAEALARGEPNRGRIALTMWRDKVRDFTGR